MQAACPRPDASGGRAGRRRVVLAAVIAGAAALVFCGDVLSGIDRWGRYDWDLFLFHATSAYRCVVEFREPPLWNPWYHGGLPIVGNPQVPTFQPSFFLDLLAGPIVAIKLKIAVHYAIGLLGMYWCCRQLGLSPLAASYAAGTFVFSTWLALHIHAGHPWAVTAAYIPWAVGWLYRGVRPRRIVCAGGVLAVMILEGGGVHVATLLCIACGLLTSCWAIQQRSPRPFAALLLMVVLGAGFSAIKLVPCWLLMRQYPRPTDVGGSIWSGYKQTPMGDATAEEDRLVGGPSPPPAARPRLPWPRFWAFLARIFLGRDQRSDVRYFPTQGFGWHEFGAYLGPLTILLLAGSPFILRAAWPWLLVAFFCSLTAAGNFSPWSPWALIHSLPVLSNMRRPEPFPDPVRLRQQRGGGDGPRCHPPANGRTARRATLGGPHPGRAGGRRAGRLDGRGAAKSRGDVPATASPDRHSPAGDHHRRWGTDVHDRGHVGQLLHPRYRGGHPVSDRRAAARASRLPRRALFRPR